MKKVLFVFLFFYCSLAAWSQVDSVNVDSFMIIRPGNYQSATNSLFLDNRDTDTLDLGYIIQKKYEGNFIFNIHPAYPLKEQFVYLLDSLNSAMHGNRQLLLQLGRLKFGGEKNKSINQRRFMFRAALFEVTEKGYCRIGAIDTVAVIDVKNNKRFILSCYRTAGDIISSFISTCLSKHKPVPAECLTLNQVEKIDSIQKSQLNLYTLNSLEEGVYTSYQSLRDQLPNYTEFDYKMKNGVPVNVEKKSNDADNMDYSFDHVYAVVINNKIFIYDNSHYHLLEKVGNDFYFKSIVETSSVPALAFATPALLMSISNNFMSKYKKEYTMKLDHLDGNFIPYKMTEKK